MRAKSLPIRHAARAGSVCGRRRRPVVARVGQGGCGVSGEIKTRTPQKPELYRQNAIMYTHEYQIMYISVRSRAAAGGVKVRRLFARPCARLPRG